MSALKRFSFKTKDGKEFPVYEINPMPGKPKPENFIKALNERLRKEYGPINERKGPDSGYNCHGMTFIGKLGWVGLSQKEVSSIIIPNNTKSINEQLEEKDIIEEILKGNGLKKKIRINNIEKQNLKGDEDIEIGDIAIYRNSKRGREEITHSAVVV